MRIDGRAPIDEREPIDGCTPIDPAGFNEHDPLTANDELFTETGEQEYLAAFILPEQAGRRLDVAITAAFPQISRNRAQSLLDAGVATLNGESVTKKTPVKEGDLLEIRPGRKIPIHVFPEEMAIDLVYEDAELLVVNKPKGLVVHPAPGNETGTLVNGLLWYLAEHDDGLSSIGGLVRPGIVHRIDKNTSGLLVIAKTDRAHNALAEQLARHEMKRVYMALVNGGFRDDAGTVDAPIDRDLKDRKRRAVMPEGFGKQAVTHFTVIERFAEATLLELRLETGRTHQIRVHMAHIGHAVLGDDLYGPVKTVRRNLAEGESQYLHAAVLGFLHPVSGQYMEFRAEPPDVFTAMLERLRQIRA